MPKIVFSENSEREFIKFTKDAKKKVIKKVRILQKEPTLGKSLKGKMKGLFSFRAWPYRIVYELDKQNNITILHIFYRQQAYG